MTHKVLVVDDEGDVRAELIEYLSDKGYPCTEAAGPGPALTELHRDVHIGIVLTDLRMPGQDGLEFLTTAKSELDRDVAFIVMTGHGDKDDAIQALRLGSQDFLDKPIDLKRLLHVVERADEMLHLRRSQRLSKESLQAEVAAKTAETRKLLTDLESAYEEALELLATVAEYRDEDTGNHIRRMGAYARLMACELGWAEERQKIIELAAPLHDIGKVGTPDAVLLKNGKLTPEEFALMQRHTEVGRRILSRSNHPVMRCAAKIAWAHHERWDGSGYPRGLRGAEIPIEARIVPIGDVYDALRSERPYKPGFSHDAAVSILLEGDGRVMPSHFDPQLLHIFRAQSGKFARVYAELKD
jgi:putative two-component system response regulator